MVVPEVVGTALEWDLEVAGLEDAGEVEQKSLEEEGEGNVEEVAQQVGEAEALLVERTAAAEEAAGAGKAAGAAGGAVVYFRGLPGPGWGFPPRHVYPDVSLPPCGWCPPGPRSHQWSHPASYWEEVQPSFVLPPEPGSLF